jgi:hypothetical protein
MIIPKLCEFAMIIPKIQQRQYFTRIQLYAEASLVFENRATALYEGKSLPVCEKAYYKFDFSNHALTIVVQTGWKKHDACILQNYNSGLTHYTYTNIIV